MLSLKTLLAFVLYAIAMPSDSPWREKVNRAVLRVISRRSWEERLEDYLDER